MALGQLQHLETLCVKTGWLAAECKAFNTENAEAIANGKKFRQNPNLYSLDTFVVTPMSKPGNCKAREHDDEQTIAEAHRKSSFSELVNPFGLLVHCFVSHYWGHDFSSTVTALDLWAYANYHSMTSVKEALVYWICLFALNQHNVAEEVGDNPQQGPFNAALAQATSGAVMVLDEEIRPFSRLWCLFELSRLKDLQRPFELICSEGSLSQPETRGNQAVSRGMLEATCVALWNTSAAKAESSVVADKYQIRAEIANQSWRGAQRFFQHVTDQDAVEKLFSDFDNFIKSLLSTKMLHILLARGQHEAAAKCCIYGAHFASKDLTEICGSFVQETERKGWLNSLLMQASDASTLQLLLEHGADAAAANTEGVTLLMEAVRHSHVAMAELLLEHGANARAADNKGGTVLLEAVRHSHVAMIKLLLEHSADARVADNKGVTPLMIAASQKNLAVAKLLLSHDADAQAASKEGSTALTGAAGGGTAMTELLLKHSSDAGAARNKYHPSTMEAPC